MTMCMAMCESSSAMTFDAFEALEAGSAREFLEYETVAPSSSDAYRLCRLTRPTKTFFRLHDEETGAHLLSASKVGDEFRISAYYDDSERGHACAVLQPCRATTKKGAQPPSYRLRFCVGAHVLDDAPVIEVFPSAFRPVAHPASLIRKLRVELPAPSGEAPCAHYAHDLDKLRRENSPERQRRRRSGSDLTLRNKLPYWKDGSLTMRFARNRVKMTSSKNFMLFRDFALGDDDGEPVEEAIFQLGKVAAKTFSCDFKSPLSPLQAFAMALAAFDSKHGPESDPPAPSLRFRSPFVREV